MAEEIGTLKLREAHILLVRNSSDVEATAEQLLKRWADDPVVQRTENKDKLIRNILMCHGDKYNRHRSLQARREATDFLIEESAKKAVEVAESKLKEVEEEKRALKRERDDALTRLNFRIEANDALQEANGELAICGSKTLPSNSTTSN
jgi:hypothetical protein